MQIGDVDFDTAAGDDYNFIFAGVAQPEEVVEQVDGATRGAHGHAGSASPTKSTASRAAAAAARPRPNRRFRRRRGQ